MRPAVVVDIGNSRMKWGRVESGSITSTASLAPDDPASWSITRAAWDRPRTWAVASVNPGLTERFRAWVATHGGDVVEISDPKLVPIQLDLEEPVRVGIDRLLAALAAKRRVGAGQPVIVISAGTAITVDLVDDDGIFRGGAILPGPWLMARSLHDYTAKLPLLELHQVPAIDPPGRNTREAITAGVMAAQIGACQVLVAEYASLCRKVPQVVMTGGSLGILIDAHFGPEILVSGPYPLVLEGILATVEGWS